MTISKGHMVKTYTVYCHNCDECLCCESSPGQNIRKVEAVDFAHDEGWTLTGKFGWVCPSCCEKGSK